jgi:DNA-binding NarL/FixJ family response regulator
VLVVDDHLLLSTTLVSVLRGAGLLAAACSSVDTETVLQRAAHRPPGLVLLDLDLGTGPDGTHRDGADLIDPLRADGWEVIVVTGTTDESEIAVAVARGAIGWIPKDAPVPDLLRVVGDAAAGRPILDRAERERLLELHRDRQRRVREEERTARALERLSRREREVLEKLAAGRRARQIAGEFVVSVSTVRSQIRAILTKLEVNSQLEAVALYRRVTGG